MSIADPDPTSSADPDPWMACMYRGDFAGAWRESDRALGSIAADEWRRPRHQQRLWRGEPLHGRSVLIHCYHGLGDTVQFLRYVPLVAAIARAVTVWIQPSLIPLAAGISPPVRVLPLHDGAPPSEADVHVEIMELPHVFRTTEATIPRHIPYLDVPGPPQSRMPRPRPRVGIAWRAGEWNPARSVPVDLVAAMLTDVRCDVETLLPALMPEERTRFTSAGPSTVAELAARMVGLDLVITVDTLFAHLSGALGRPTWILLPHDADWRWMRDRTDSPWYPTARLFRQRRRGEWRQVVRTVALELRRWCASERRCKRYND
jgi:hypothetical protein